jgi:uncharacterized protein (DUF427 family)
MKVPGKDHPIDIVATPNRVRVTFAGRVVADTTDALSLNEASYPTVHYLPRKDVDMALLKRTDRTSHCPYKGDAVYFSIETDGQVAENAVWSYEQPYPAMAPIAGRVAFYRSRVDSIDETPA